MAEVTSEQIYEGLEVIHARLGGLEKGLREVADELRDGRSDMQAQDLPMTSMRTDLSTLVALSTTLDPRFSRIECRLGPVVPDDAAKPLS